MSADRDELVRNWLIKSSRDLLCARELADASKPLLDSAVYHCQQAAEKAVKGFLIYHDTRFDKTHDIGLLAGQAAVIEPEFNEFQEAFEATALILTFVSSVLPAGIAAELNEVLSTVTRLP